VEKNTILLELIHGGIYNGQRVPTHRDGQYFIAFVDDFSKYCYTYFTSFRSGLFDKFKTYKAKVENRLEKKIKILWSTEVVSMLLLSKWEIFVKNTV